MTDGQWYLHTIYFEVRELRRLLEIADAKKLSTLPGSMAPKDVQVQTSKRKDPLGDAISDYVDMAGLIEPKVKALKKHKSDALDMIYKIEDPRYREILLLRYFKVKEDGDRPSWDEIADEIGYSYRHTTKTHHAAMEAFERIYAAARV